MTVELVSENCRTAWNSFIHSQPSSGFLQSWEWGEFKKKMGWKAFRIAVKKDGEIAALAHLLIRPIPPGLTSVAYVPRGPIGRWQEPDVFSELMQAIHDLAVRNHAVFLKLEPALLSCPENACFLEGHGFHFSQATNQPRCTIQVGLTGELDTIFAQIRKSTRRKITSAANKGVTTRVGDTSDLPTFYELMCITAQRAGFVPRKYEYYEAEWGTFFENENALMMLGFYEGKPIAAHVSYYFGKHAAFFHQASSNEYSSLNPNSLLVWESMKILKARGCSNFDLWGIPDEIGELITSQGAELPDHERTDGLWGPYQFKSGFCKNIVYYMGAYDYVYQPVLYAVINNNFFRSEILERLSTIVDGYRSN
jgi:peptidoglycan pentaglycine glycine transferase (the first glycine)